MTDSAGDRAGVCEKIAHDVEQTDSCGDHVRELIGRRRLRS